jgi:hypothetical protein
MIHSAPIFKDGAPVGLRGFIIDITARKKAEEERRNLEVQFQQAQRFEALGTLAGGIAHEKAAPCSPGKCWGMLAKENLMSSPLI